MKSPKVLIRRLLNDDEGATSVEYAIMAGLIATVVVGAVALLGNNVNTLFSSFVEQYPE